MESSENTANGGGQGTILADPHHSRADVRLLGRAVRNGWPVTDEIREICVSKLATIVEKSPEEKNVISASKVIVAMHGQNQKDDPAPRQVIHEHQHVLTVDEKRKRLLALLDSERGPE